MRFIEPSVEYWKQPEGIDGIWSQIAKATRVCYQSKPREGETDKEFAERVILKPALNKDGSYDFNKMHGAMLEHGTVYLTIPFIDETVSAITTFQNNPYSKVVSSINNDKFYVTTNMRVIFENDLSYILKYLDKLTKYHIKRYTFSVITDIGVTREMNRHRAFSIAEQSTRYCDFNKDKFGDELTFIRPAWWKDTQVEETDIMNYETYLSESEYFYKMLRKQGWKPEQARQVLPLGLKTQAIYTAFEDDWFHFLKLRADNVSGRVHPNMWMIADMIRHEMIKEEII